LVRGRFSAIFGRVFGLGLVLLPVYLLIAGFQFTVGLIWGRFLQDIATLILNVFQATVVLPIMLGSFFSLFTAAREGTSPGIPAGKGGLVALAIVGCVAVIAVPIGAAVVLSSLNTAQEKANDARRVADVKQIDLALALFYDTNNAYPSSLEKLAPLDIAFVPVDPSGKPYAYTPSADGTSYTLCAPQTTGPDYCEEQPTSTYPIPTAGGSVLD
jgi:hypothetical protein